MKTFNKNDFVHERASIENSVRKRNHHLIHDSHCEPVQFLYINLCSESYIPPHKHINNNQWEFFQLLDGEIDLLIFTDDGRLENRLHLNTHDLFSVKIPANVFHTILCRSEYALMLEVKEGPFKTEYAKEIACWASEEKIDNSDWLKKLRILEVGQRL
ncbi:MAG: WbuC family cupin fold metalloprotein [Leclercia sp.]